MQRLTAQRKIQKIGLIVSTLNNPFFVDLKSGIEKRAKELGYDVVVLDSQNDPAKEVSNMEDLTVKDVDIVLLNPVDSDSAIASVMIANNSNLPVMTVDRVANGGKGKISKTIVGALIMGVLSNALNLLDVSSYYQMMVKGVVILIAVLLDRKNK